jgi:hypothetical protein
MKKTTVMFLLIAILGLTGLAGCYGPAVRHDNRVDRRDDRQDYRHDRRDDRYDRRDARYGY